MPNPGPSSLEMKAHIPIFPFTVFKLSISITVFQVTFVLQECRAVVAASSVELITFPETGNSGERKTFLMGWDILSRVGIFLKLFLVARLKIMK